MPSTAGRTNSSASSGSCRLMRRNPPKPKPKRDAADQRQDRRDNRQVPAAPRTPGPPPGRATPTAPTQILPDRTATPGDTRAHARASQCRQTAGRQPRHRKRRMRATEMKVSVQDADLPAASRRGGAEGGWSQGDLPALRDGDYATWARASICVQASSRAASGSFSPVSAAWSSSERIDVMSANLGDGMGGMAVSATFSISGMFGLFLMTSGSL